MAQDEPHISVSQLWEYSQEPIFQIQPEDINHLRECEDCVAVIWLCRSVPSIEAVEARLKDGSNLDEGAFSWEIPARLEVAKAPRGRQFVVFPAGRSL